MASYDQEEYLQRIVSDALTTAISKEKYQLHEDEVKGKYKIAKADYEAFRKKYVVKKEE